MKAEGTRRLSAGRSVIKGHAAELGLRKRLQDVGYEVRRVAASRFPDLIVWDEESFNLVEVKVRDNPDHKRMAKSLFKTAASQMKSPPQGDILLALRCQGDWEMWAYRDGKLEDVSSMFYWLTGVVDA